MPKLLEDFESAIAPLCQRPTSARCLKTGAGYAYAKLVKEGEPAELSCRPAHAMIVGEKLEGHKRALADIRKAETVPEGGIHIGVAGFVNLGYIAANRSSGAILMDSNPVQKVFWDIIIDMLSVYETKEDFILALPSVPFQLVAALDKLNCGQEYILLDEDLSYDAPLETVRHKGRILFETGEDQGQMDLFGMRTDEDYTHLHKLAKVGAIAALTLDLKDAQGFNQLKTAMEEFKKASGCQERQIYVSSFYVSNVLEFLHNRRDFNGVENMPNARNMVLRNIASLLSAFFPKAADKGPMLITYDRTYNPLQLDGVSQRQLHMAMK
tara:strand:- start:817 stop:1791 length:975 start_codon:yes stop_codon:yes gene_type:complete